MPDKYQVTKEQTHFPLGLPAAPMMPFIPLVPRHLSTDGWNISTCCGNRVDTVIIIAKGPVLLALLVM